MVRRYRPRVALLALLTLFAYAAEGAAALVLCSPAETEARVTMGEPPSGHGAHDQGVPSGPGADTETQHDDHCPLDMASGGSCAVASLPAALTKVQTVPVTADLTWSAAATQVHSAPANPLFHPPRA